MVKLPEEVEKELGKEYVIYDEYFTPELIQIIDDVLSFPPVKKEESGVQISTEGTVYA
jgi:hypothetical protein